LVRVRMGKFDKQLAHWRELHRVAVEDLEDLQSGRKRLAEDTGEGWVNATDPWIDRVRNESVVFAQIIAVYEKLNARNG
jgi:DNA phosphorothioation-dependent restriction protein DptG